jgi:5-methylcytosine-specific restriction endonuclease McrA
MNTETISERYCRWCQKVKPLTEFHSNPRMNQGRANKCNECTPKRTFVKCSDCPKTWMKSNSSFNNWQGRCASCAQIVARSKPELVAKISEKARIQVLRQGGVPNAKKFTKEHCGPNHNHWKGGISPENQRQRGTSAYKLWRIAVFHRDHYTCQHCGQVGGELNADHILPFAYYPELRLELSNGRTLCLPCHEKTPSYKKKRKS